MSSRWIVVVVGLIVCVAHVRAEGAAPVSRPDYLEATLRSQWTAIGEELKLRKIDEAALGHASSWQEAQHGTGPTAGKGGRVVFAFGTVLPRVVCTPLRVCDVELQMGERINNVHVGDGDRWSLEPATAGNTVHVVIKPLVANISTNVAIYTDKRVYHLELQSSDKGDHMAFVGFTYPEDKKAAWLAMRPSSNASGADSAMASGDDAVRADAEISANPAALYFGYKVKKAGWWHVRRRINWAPTRVYDDGEKTVIELPREIMARELPVLFVRDGAGNDKLRPYTVKGHHFIVSGVFDRAALVKGVGTSQERVELTRESK